MFSNPVIAVPLAFAAIIAESYVLGSIDTGIIVSRFFYHDDVREHGSGAAGMTNMLRTFGKKAAVVTAVGDVLKGFLAAYIAIWIMGLLAAQPFIGGSDNLPLKLGAYLAMVFAVNGHAKPIFFNFKGGKGVLVAGGAILATEPVLIPILGAIFLICLFSTGMVSLGSIVMAAVYPFLALAASILRGYPPLSVLAAFTCALAVGMHIIFLHSSNIKRIKKGEEYRFKVGRYKNK